MLSLYFTLMQKVPSVNNALDFMSLVSWNIRGLGHPVKRGKVFSHLKSLKSDIIFLQETHVKATQLRKLRANWISQVYPSPFTSKARGVAILFRKTVPFRFQSSTTDPNGRFLIVTGHINSFPVTLVNTYGPNMDDPAFFSKGVWSDPRRWFKPHSDRKRF